MRALTGEFTLAMAPDSVMAASGSYKRNLGVHIFTQNHEAEKVNQEQGETHP